MDIIITHINADFDAIASAVAAQKLYPQARIFFPGSRERNVREFTALYPDVISAAIKAKTLKTGTVTRLILVDVSSPERLGEFKYLLRDPKIEVIRYDHHENTADSILAKHRVIKGYGANTSIMVEILQQQNILLTGMEATLLALGIYEETGNLTYTSTSPQDLEAAAYLLKCGADLTLVNEFVKRTLSREQQDLFDDLIKSRETLNINGTDISLVLAEREKFVEDLAVLVNRIKEIEHLPVLFAFCRMGNRAYCIARSNVAAVHAGDITAILGGGGHATAASAVLKETDLAAMKRNMLAILKRQVARTPMAQSIMSTPVISVSASATIAAARRLMMRYGHSGLPVLENESLVGIITLHDLDKALHHGLEKSTVRQFMSTRLVLAQPCDSLAYIQRRMLEKNINHIPVVEKNTLLGIITRANILHSLGDEKQVPVQRDFVTKSPMAPPPDRAELRRMMQAGLPERILALLHTAGEIADQMGMQAFVVGGFVRDILLRAENWDLDIVIEGDGIAYAKQLAKRLGGSARLHERFQTAKIKCRGGLVVDIATARTEFYAQPAALPQVEAASIKYDLYRRDFSINAMAIKVNTDDFGQLVDIFGGVHDLQDGYIRVLYSVSFVDDPTRIFRAVRFEQRYNFTIEEDTERYIHNAVKMDLVSRLSWPRVFDELMLIFDEEQPVKALIRLATLGVLPWIHPSLKKVEPLAELFENIWETFAFAVLFLEETIDRRLVYLMALLEHVSEAETRNMAKQYQFPRRVTEVILVQKKYGDRILQKITALKKARPSQVVQYLHGLPCEVVLYEMAKSDSRSQTSKWLREYLTRWRHVRSLVGGRDLKKLGYPPSPLFDEILTKLRAQRLDGKLLSRQDEIAFLHKHYPYKG
ncbi:CBS domain-containing protein [bacterium]|nr:CBS domain-containing protein [bacterium]